MEKKFEKNGSYEKVSDDRELTDIALVAYLVTLGLKIMKIDRKIGKSIFHFLDTQNLEAETLKYFNHEAKVDPLQFSETLRNLRSYAKQG